MSNEALFESAARHLKAIDLCIENGLRIPALILVYSGMDIFASLDRPEKKDEATREDFIAWCDKYLLKQNKFPCSATDIYAARCGVVHANISESRLSRSKKAKEIIYSWGNQGPESLQSTLDSLGYEKHVIHIESLAEAFKNGVQLFLEDVKNDPDRISLVLSRAGEMFKDQPKEFWR